MLEESPPPLLTLRGDLLNPTEVFREEAGHPPLRTALVVLDMGVVGLAGQDHQVRGVVVGAVAVQMVNDLAGEKGRQARAKLETDLMEIMTEEQKKKFAELGGEPFDVNPMDLIAPPMGLDSAIFPPSLPPLPDPEGDVEEGEEEMEEEEGVIEEDADAPAPGRPSFGPALPPRP